MKTSLRNLALAAAGAMGLSISGSSARAVENAPRPAGDYSVHHVVETVRAQYLLFLPKDYSATPRHRWPLILFLHGIGECGSNIWATTVHGPSKYIQKHAGFPFMLLSPQCPVGQKWSDEMVLGILDKVTAQYAVDTNRIYLTGLSQGGYGVWSLATTYPERFAAAAPISGGGDLLGPIVCEWNKPRDQALRTLPFWVFHGGKDPVVPVTESERMVAALKKFGCKDVKLTVYPEAQHDAWTQTYDNPELYQWFLEQARHP